MIFVTFVHDFHHFCGLKKAEKKAAQSRGKSCINGLYLQGFGGFGVPLPDTFRNLFGLGALPVVTVWEAILRLGVRLGFCMNLEAFGPRFGRLW